MDVVQNYDPDFIYTDGTSTQPFSGDGTGTGLKADAMQRVIADYYNRTLVRRGKLDVFSIVKFRPPTNGTVNTEEFGVPREIKTNQPWIGEVQVGDWFYRPGFDYPAASVIRYIIEAAARDGGAAICVCLRPDGSLDDGSKSMLRDIGHWMRTNGEAIYGSRAWSIPGEGQTDANKNLLMIPGGAITAIQSQVPFDTRDFRFTVGANGRLHAICLAVPTPGEVVTIKSLGTSVSHLDKPVESVRLLGANGQRLRWIQRPEGLQITCPAAPCSTAVAFEIR
jgi:alpha-L-fucosidase